MSEEGKAIALAADLTSILENISDGFWVLDPQGYCLYSNHKQAQIFGVALKDIVGKNVWKMFPDILDSNIYSQLNQAFTQQKFVCCDRFLPQWQRWFEFRAYPSAQGLSIYTIDITERKQAEAVIRGSEERFRHIIDAIPQMVWTCKPSGEVEYYNQNTLEVLGITLEQVLLESWHQFVHPQDLQPAIDAWSDAIKTGSEYEVEYRLKMADGCYRWHLGRAVPKRDQTGKITRWFGTCTNIEARKQEEKRQAVQYAVARVLAEATTVKDAVPTILKSLCESLGWQLGLIWSVDRHDNILRCVNSWNALNVNLEEFISTNQSTTFSLGIGLPGRVWASGKPIWVENLNTDHNFPRAGLAAKGGMQAAFGFPIQVGNKIIGVIECFSNQVQAPDQNLLQMMAAIGSQIGQFMERKQAEEALRESQELFQSFMNYSPIAAFIKDEAGRYIYAKPLIAHPPQLLASDLVGKTDFDLFPTEIAQKLRDNDAEVLAKSEAIQFSEIIQHEDGEHHYLSFKFPCRDASGRQLLAGASIDVSDRIQAEAKIQKLLAQIKSERELLESVLQQMPAGVILAEAPSGKLILFNNQVKEVWRIPALLPIEDINHGKAGYEGFHPDGRAYQLEEWPLYRAIYKGEVVIEEEIHIKRGDGTKGIILVNAAPVYDSQNQIKAGVATFYDITERKQTEAALRESQLLYQTLAEAMPHHVWTLTPAGKLDYVNKRYQEVLGMTIEQVNRDGWGTFVHPEDLPSILEDWAKIQAGEMHTETEYRHLMPDGTYRWFLGRVVAIRDYAGKLLQCVGTSTDIDERKRAEEALRSSEERLALASVAANIGTFEWNVQTNQVVWTEEEEALYGLPPGGFGGKLENWQQALHPEDRDRAVQEVQAAAANSTDLNNEFRIIWPDGSIHWIAARGRIFRDQDGKAVRMIGVNEDITNRKQTEAALRASAERLSLALAAAKMGDWSWDALTDLVTFSEQAAEIFGIPAGPYMTWTQMRNILAPEDRERVRIAVEQAILTHSNYDVEYRVIHPNRGQRWVAAKGRAQYDSSGNVLEMIGVVQDISERKITEVAQSLLAEASSVLVSSLNYQTTLNNIARLLVPTIADLCFFDLVNSNGRIERIGCQHHDALKQEWFSQVQQYAPTLDIQNHPTLQALSSGKVIMISEITDTWLQTIARNSQHLQFMQECQLASMIVVPLIARNRKLGALHLFLTPASCRYYQDADLTVTLELAHRIALALDNAQLYQQAQEANRIKDEFLAVLSHELRSPLNPILGWTKLLRTRKFEPPVIAKALETIERNAKLQAELIEDLLDISRILRGKMVLNVAPVNLVDIITAALETVRLASEAKGIQIQTILPHHLGQVSGDSVRLQQIVWNLLSNAIKFTPEGGRIEVRLSVEKVGEKKGDKEEKNSIQNPKSSSVVACSASQNWYAQIQVKDTGKGINPDFLPYVFEYFRQEDGTTTRKFGGLGLGLAIARHLTELHGGTVQAESPGEGLGATFTVRLPLMTTTVDTNQNNQPLAESPDLSKLRILVVDDEVDMRELLVAILEPYGAHVKVAASAAEVLSVLEQFQPHVLISDIGMPTMDGYILMRQVRRLLPKQGGLVEAIALTAYAGEINQQQALAAGFQKHIAKPVEPSELVGAIVALVGRGSNG